MADFRSCTPAQLVELVLPLSEQLGVSAAVGVVPLAHTPGFEDFFVIGFDKHIAERADLGVAEDSG